MFTDYRFDGKYVICVVVEKHPIFDSIYSLHLFTPVAASDLEFSNKYGIEVGQRI